VNGTSVGKPSKLGFGAGSTELACGGSTPSIIGKLKLMGMSESELITVKNP
jgi:hypothetical protein